MNRITVGVGSRNKIKVVTTPKDRIEINTTSGGGGGVETLRQLKDVDATNLVDGNSIVYDAESDKFKVEPVPIVNGGTF